MAGGTKSDRVRRGAAPADPAGGVVDPALAQVAIQRQRQEHRTDVDRRVGIVRRQQ